MPSTRVLVLSNRQGNDRANLLNMKQNNIRKSAASAPKFQAGQNFNSFRIQYESWRRASGMLETYRVAAVAADPAQGIAGNDEYDQALQIAAPAPRSNGPGALAQHNQVAHTPMPTTAIIPGWHNALQTA